MNKLGKKILFPIFLIIVTLLISFSSVYQWFLDNSILYYWDTLISFDVKYSLAFLNSWFPGIYPGVSGSGLSWILYVLPFSLIENFFQNLSMAQFFIYVFLILFSILNFYILAQYLFKLIFKKEIKFLKVFIFLFSVMYALNLYTFYYAYFLFNPEGYILAFLPLNILALLHLLPLSSNEKIKNYKLWLIVFFVSLFLMTPGFTTYIFFIQYFGWVFVYLLFYFFISKEKLKFKFLKSLLFVILIVLANWWWLFPAYLELQSSYLSQRFTADTTAYIELNSKNSNLLNSLRLIGSTMMTNNPFSWFSFYIEKNIFNFVLFFFPFLILFLVFKIKTLINKKLILFLFLMFLISLFLVKLGNPPRADITVWLFKHIPFFDAFRDAQHKAGLFYTFSYFLLSFIGYYLLISYLDEKKRRVLKYSSISFLVIGFFIVTGPFFLFRNDNIKRIDYEFNGKKYSFNAKTQIPKEYYELKKVLEKQCRGKTTIVIPRATAISNAVWEKYNTSYVGQEVLSRFVNCNLISSKVGDNNPDAFTNAAYYLLQNNDFPSFKNYLLQNNISLVLIRKDNVPFYYTSWFYTNPNEAINKIKKDSDFQKLYEDDFFNLYSLETGNSDKFGFSTASNIIYTNSPLTAAIDYAVIAKTMGTHSGNFLINDSDNLKKFSGLINQYVSIANCVGCVQISSEDIFNENTESSITKKIKDFLKKYLRRDYEEEAVDIKISKRLINSNLELQKVIQAIKNKDVGKTKISSEKYFSDVNSILDMLKNYRGNFFDKNQKLLETKNFLAAQNNTLVKLFPKVSDLEMEGYLSFLMAFQREGLDFIDKNIWQTDKENKVYRARLDIAKEGEYLCSVNSFASGITPTKIYLNNESAPSINITQFFKAGSYPISIEYEILKITQFSDFRIKNIKRLDLRGLERGSYKLSFNAENIKSPLVTVFTNKRIDMNNFGELLLKKLGENTVYDYLPSGNKSSINYEKNYSVDPLLNENYYLYFVALRPYQTNQNEEVLKNLLIEKNPEENSIVFYCKKAVEVDSGEDKIEVTKINNVEYKVKLPKNSSAKFLLFNQSFHDDWIAFSSSNEKPLEHIKNGYGNAWNIPDNINGEIRIAFSRQNLIIKNIFLSLILFVAILFIFLKIKDERDNK